jgi:hypothetical protein
MPVASHAPVDYDVVADDLATMQIGVTEDETILGDFKPQAHRVLENTVDDDWWPDGGDDLHAVPLILSPVSLMYSASRAAAMQQP